MKSFIYESYNHENQAPMLPFTTCEKSKFKSVGGVCIELPNFPIELFMASLDKVNNLTFDLRNLQIQFVSKHCFYCMTEHRRHNQGEGVAERLKN